MIKSVFATKIKIDQAWDKNGRRIPVTVFAYQNPIVTQLKTKESDGYGAVQIGFKPSTKLNKPAMGHLKKLNLAKAVSTLKEVKAEIDSQLELAQEIQVFEILKPGDIVKVSALSKGTGFTGVMKRWGFSGGKRTHGQSDRERAPGSIGQGTTPGRVWKGKKMAGRSGGAKVSVLNLLVVKVDQDNKQIWVKGLTPGSINSLSEITKLDHKEFVGLSTQETEKIENSEASNE